MKRAKTCPGTSCAGAAALALLLLAGTVLCGCPPELRPATIEAPTAESSPEKSEGPAAATKLPRTVDGSEPAVVLLMTNPSRSRVKDFLYLVHNRIFYVPGLRIEGIFPAAAAERFEATRELLEAEGIGWFALRPVSCEIPEEQIFTRNPCVDTFGELVEGSAGLLLNGGPDIPPRYYGEKTQLTTIIEDPPRHQLEISLLHHLLAEPGESAAGLAASRPDYMVFGICLGMQTLNVALGGTMIQDIPSELYRVRTLEGVLEQEPDQRHRSAQNLLAPLRRPDYWVMHAVEPREGWPFGPVGGEEAASYRVVSAHHQAIEKLGDGLETLATSTDGKVVEAVGHTRYPNVMGVQFHPEYRMTYEVEPGASTAPLLATEGKPNDPAMRVFHVRLWRVVAQQLLQAARSSQR